MPVHDSREVGRSACNLHPTLPRVSRILASLGLRVFLVGARSLIFHGIDLGRETRDWDTVVDRTFTPELRDLLTEALRSEGFKVQWRKWGFLVEDDVHIDINYAPLTLDEEFVRRSRAVAEGVLLPCVEDLIVLKLMSGERKDIEDIKRVLRQSWNALDKEYLYRRAQQAGLERELEKILRRLGLV